MYLCTLKEFGTMFYFSIEDQSHVWAWVSRRCSCHCIAEMLTILYYAILKTTTWFVVFWKRMRFRLEFTTFRHSSRANPYSEEKWVYNPIIELFHFTVRNLVREVLHSKNVTNDYVASRSSAGLLKFPFFANCVAKSAKTSSHCSRK